MIQLCHLPDGRMTTGQVRGEEGAPATSFEVVAGAIILEARVDNRPVTAMIDTGISLSMVEPRLAVELGLGRSRAATFQSEHGPVVANIAGPVSLEIGGGRWRLPSVIVAHAPFLAQTAIGVGVVIGQDVLRTAAFAIDFTRGRLCVLAEPTSLEREGFVRVPVLTDNNGRIVLHVDLPTVGPAAAIFDLGSNAALMIDAGFVRDHDLCRDIATSTGLIATLGGISETAAFSLPMLTIAGLPVRDVPADVLFRWSSPQPLNLGLGLVRQFDLVLDLPRDAIWLRPIEGATFERERSGALVAYRGDHLEVVHVARDSPAQAAGLERGAIIVAINGHPVDNAYFTGDAWRWRHGPAGRSIKLTLPHGEVVLRLNRYY